MSRKHAFWLAPIFGIVLGCSSETEGKSSAVFLGQLKSLVSEIYSDDPVDPRDVITRTMINGSNTPLILVEFLNSGKTATMEIFPGSTLAEVWLGADGSTLTTKNGFLISTRGVGHDLMGANLGMTKKALNGALQGKDSFNYERSFKYLVRDNQEKILKFNCAMSRENTEIIYLFEKKYVTQRVVEICKNKSQSFQNTYWNEKNGKIRKSIQWHGISNDLILIERLI